jgi:DNA segregation ATPase FtsK/SpoIIIE-like protein
VTNDEADLAVLEALGADKPLWRRKWVSEDRLSSSKRDKDEIDETVERLAKAKDVLLHVRFTSRGRFLFLERSLRTPTAPNEADAGIKKPRSVSGAPAPSIEKKRSVEMSPQSGRPPWGQKQTKPGMADGLPTNSSERPVPEKGRAAVDRTTLYKVLRSFGVQVEDIDHHVQIGPTVSRFRILLDHGSRLADLRRRSEDISRELGCETELLISHLPGERYVALDLPTPVRQVVPLTPALDSLPTDDLVCSLWIAVGITPAGANVNLDLVTLPHLLVAGASGSGKSVWIQGALLSLATRLDPADLEIVVIDPKGVDFSPFANLPHLRGGHVINEPEEAIEVLRELTGSELASRTRLLQAAGCSNLRELRAKGAGAKYIVVMIDEFAELVTILQRTERVIFEREVLRLAQRARAAGIHLVIATQRPTTNLITGAIKTNLSTRISFRLPQRVDSMSILDEPGAESLLGAGDMLLLHDGKLQRLQGYFAPTETITNLISTRALNKKG